MTVSQDHTKTVSTTLGPVVGFRDTFGIVDRSKANDIVNKDADGGREPVWKWLGIPYGQAQRWKCVEPPLPWTDPRPCFEFGSKFPQPPSSSEKLYEHHPNVHSREWVQQSEDSFTVNVFAPRAIERDTKVPVMVWIYGGSLNNGSADRFLYDPTELVRASERDGFFSGPDVLAADKDGLSGNYGLRDTVAILEWVQRNIESFGGDNNNVTVFGESAGGFIVSSLLVTGKKLFKKAIMQSGAAGTMRIKPHDTAYPGYQQVFVSHGPSAATPEARIEALRQVSWQDLLQTHNQTFGWGGLALTLEQPGSKAIWTQDTVDKLKRGEWDEWIESVILGTTEDEGSLFCHGMKLNSPQGFEGYLKFLPSTIHQDVRQRYLPSNGQHPETCSIIDAPASKILADSLFVDPTYQQAVSLSQGGRCKVWLYRCRAEVDAISRGSIKMGAMHMIEIPLVFNICNLWHDDPERHEYKSSQVLRRAWTLFATSGQPSKDWKPFTAEDPSWFAVSDGGITANESLQGYAARMLDWSGKGHSKAEEVLGGTNE
ncbi:hypothetical protein OIO90_004865 [Microbotryomycetes sp. JL221]|nr:hypothetical protein OIO90_004865 [Microbotryomycetes sp. JL221]